MQKKIGLGNYIRCSQPIKILQYYTNVGIIHRNNCVRVYLINILIYRWKLNCLSWPKKYCVWLFLVCVTVVLSPDDHPRSSTIVTVDSITVLSNHVRVLHCTGNLYNRVFNCQSWL